MKMTAALIVLVFSALAYGQSSSLMRAPAARPAASEPVVGSGSFVVVAPRQESKPATRALEQYSMIGIAPQPPRKFKVNDLITIIVRQQKSYEADGRLDNKNKWTLDGKLSDWFRFYDDLRHLGSDRLTNGQPGFKFDYKNDYKAESRNDREDRFSTRLTGRIIDVKPNGNLVLEATWHEQHDEEKFTITLTGTCRSEDVTPDNSILSTQIADLNLVEKNEGAVRDGTRRGWIPKILDWGKPF